MRRALVMLAMLAVLVGQVLIGPAWSAGPAGAQAQGGRVALIGVPGLHWNDLTPSGTPHLWALAGSSAIGSLSVRTVGNVTCPYDGWLTVSAGTRAAVGYACGAPPKPEARGAGAVIPDYRYLIDVAGQRTAGTLGESLKAAGQCSVAIGPGAALALADQQGAVGRYHASPLQVTTADLEQCRMVAADVDDLVAPYLAGEPDRLPKVADKLAPAARREALRQADAKAGALLAALPAGTTVLLAGLSDHGSVPHLRVAALREPGAEGRLLGAASTRRDDISILTDLTATVLDKLGVAVPSTVVGAPLRLGEQGATVEGLKSADATAQTMRSAKAAYFTALAVFQVLFYVLAFLLLRRRKGLPWVRRAAVALAALPVTSFLVNLLPWDSHLELFGGMALWWAAITALALAGPWRRRPLGPLAVVAAITALTLVGDLLTGTTLQLNSFMGYSAEQGARYFGLGNIPFALLATGTLLATTVIAHRWPGKVGVGAIVVLGAFAMVLGGSGMGSDFGGVIAFVPGIAVTALILSGKRVSLVKLGAFCVAGGVIVMGFAWLNYLRPPAEQSHLGRFVGQVLTGEAIDVIWRKFLAMISTLANPNLMPIVIAAVAFLVYAILRPEQASAGVVPAAFEHSPALRAGLIGTLVSGVVGMLVNDSGAAVLSMALALAVPLLLATGIGALRREGGSAPGVGEQLAGVAK
ncbi:hypothetical protein [Nonomuraea gerenzanensis]|uniref:Uncharacterized protein n=1 Tax=Nonomuraea gerenzanensis TaxID=93944 RepID=A0A1M4EHV0_9ACTN|nr:hypothetical protein [Nonomuraea gerenzanensis]UBU09928.1 hypothetical protein LCN96_37000 [Nonomuraea gerenzanensis]SBO98380.1 hypothetical protein BN4615_P7896 [Nonomuraea gerenzanensis]